MVDEYLDKKANRKVIDYFKTDKRYRSFTFLDEPVKFYEEELIKVLKDVGMFGMDVKQISTGKTGRFSMCPMSYSSVECNVKFAPYTVKGQLLKILCLSVIVLQHKKILKKLF